MDFLRPGIGVATGVVGAASGALGFARRTASWVLIQSIHPRRNQYLAHRAKI